MKNESIAPFAASPARRAGRGGRCFARTGTLRLAEAMKRPKLACETEPPSLPPACPPRGTRPTKSLPPVIV